MRKILFDLDGTLINSQEGVTKCVAYALESKGIHIEDVPALKTFIGPPLYTSFTRDYPEFTHEEKNALIDKYHERYDVVGKFECVLYPEVMEVLKYCHDKGYITSIGSSKPEESCVEILTHFGVDKYLNYIVGASLGPERREKADVLKEALKRMGGGDLSDYVLIGDTHFDVDGAKEVGMDCVGITYGFGTRKELEEAGAIAVFDTLKEAVEYLEKE